MILKKAEKLNTFSEDAVVIHQKYGKETDELAITPILQQIK